MDTWQVNPNLEEINFPKMPWTVEQKKALENSQKALETLCMLNPIELSRKISVCQDHYLEP